ncbi:MAG: hypothetical protein JZU52_05975 [Lamprocystis purpurea]|nr:hypothetical protein [Lamprocystis purpurea]
MACRICGSEGHNARTCPQLPVPQNDAGEDYVVWARYGGLSKSQAKDIRNGLENVVD